MKTDVGVAPFLGSRANSYPHGPAVRCWDGHARTPWDSLSASLEMGRPPHLPKFWGGANGGTPETCSASHPPRRAGPRSRTLPASRQASGRGGRRGQRWTALPGGPALRPDRSVPARPVPSRPLKPWRRRAQVRGLWRATAGLWAPSSRWLTFIAG